MVYAHGEREGSRELRRGRQPHRHRGAAKRGSWPSGRPAHVETSYRKRTKLKSVVAAPAKVARDETRQRETERCRETRRRRSRHEGDAESPARSRATGQI